MTACGHTNADVTSDEVTGYINAGGRGTRLNSIFAPNERTGVTKALLTVGSPPLTLIDHQVTKLLSAGINNVVVGAGDHELVADYVSDKYGDLGFVDVALAKEQLGNGGDLICAVRDRPEWFSPAVVIVNVDTVLDWDEASAIKQHRDSAAGMTINLTLARGVPNQDAFFVCSSGRVLYSHESSENVITSDEAEALAAYRGSSTGALVADTKLLAEMSWTPPDGPISLYSGAVKFFLVEEMLYAYNNGKRFFIDVGTVNTWKEVCDNPEILAPYLCYPHRLHGE